MGQLERIDFNPSNALKWHSFGFCPLLVEGSGFTVAWASLGWVYSVSKQPCWRFERSCMQPAEQTGVCVWQAASLKWISPGYIWQSTCQTGVGYFKSLSCLGDALVLISTVSALNHFVF